MLSHMGKFFLLLRASPGFETQIPPKSAILPNSAYFCQFLPNSAEFYHLVPNPRLKAHIPALRPKFEPQGQFSRTSSSPEAQISAPRPLTPSYGLNLSPKAHIFTNRSRRRMRNVRMCENIGHRRLRGRCHASPLNFNHNLLR